MLMTEYHFHYWLVIDIDNLAHLIMISTLAHSGNDHSSNWRKFFETYLRMVFRRRKIPDRGKKVLMFLYRELVRPHLKY